MKAFRKVSIFSIVTIFSLLFILSSSSIFAFSYSSNNNTSNPITVLAKHQYAFQIDLSSGYVYWNNNGSQIRRVSESGGTVQKVLNSSDITSFTLSGNFLYWSTETSVNKIDLSTHETTVLCTENTSEYCLFPTSIQVSGNYVFFAAELSTIVRMDTNGSDLTVLTGNLFACPTGVTLSGGYVYWSDLCTGQVGKVSFSGQNAQLLGPDYCGNRCSYEGFTGIHSITVANSNIYWTYNVSYQNNSYFELVNSISTSGTQFKTLFKGTSSSGTTTSVSYHNDSVIFPYLTESSSKIYSVPAGGGKLTVLAKVGAIDSEVSGGYLYFSAILQIDKLAL